MEFDRGTLKILPLAERKNKITIDDVYGLDYKIPNHDNPDLDDLAKDIIMARQRGGEVIWMMGAHTLRRGNSRFIIDLMERGIITHIATNGACAIHDFELALIGATCEDVEAYIKEGEFGNWEETGFFVNKAVIDGRDCGMGYGESIGRMIEYSWVRHVPKNFPHKEISIFAAAFRMDIPITVHKLIGGDITDQHPWCDYSALGWCSGKDFLGFTESISKLEGGVFLNTGSAVTGPEIYLKALSMARNKAKKEGKEIKNFTTAVFDIIDLGDWRKEDEILDPRYYFRPKKTILIRTIKDGGKSFYIRGDLGLTIPNLYKRLIRESINHNLST